MSVSNFKWVEEWFQFSKYFIKNCNEGSDKGYFIEVHVQYLEKLDDLNNDLPFLPERIKIEKVEKIIDNLLDKK